MRHLFLFLFSGMLLSGFLAAQSPKSALKNGDMIFLVNPSGQGKAIQLATHSKYTHIGIVFIENGKAFVYHAVEPVTKSTLEEFVAMSADKTYEVKRLKNQSVLTPAAIETLRKAAIKDLGKHYDLGFSWDDDKLYCSEYVWKLYKRSLNLDIGSLKPLKSFDLSHPAVKAKLHERYGNEIPLNENMISPGDMFSSELVE
ncbi:peptidoglycan peptidase [Sphingobacteriaceae bacterium]|nr:peptidoglycan peptidase [Sphingobacteriaceae bacterium]